MIKKIKNVMLIPAILIAGNARKNAKTDSQIWIMPGSLPGSSSYVAGYSEIADDTL